MTNRIEDALRALAQIETDMRRTAKHANATGVNVWVLEVLEFASRIAGVAAILRQTEAAPSTPKECCGNYNYNGDCCGRYVTTTNSAPVDSSLVVGPADSSQGEPWNIEVVPVVVRDVSDAHYVRLSIGCQHFNIGPDYLDTRADAEWFKTQLDTALRRAKATIPHPGVYWLIERNQIHGEPEARWFSERKCFAQADEDLWVMDVMRAERFQTRELAEISIRERFTDDSRYPVIPIATEHLDVATPPPSSPQVAVADGYAIVPIEPTQAMKDAWAQYKINCANSGTQRTAGGHYRAMIAAAPAPPQFIAPQSAPKAAEPVEPPFTVSMYGSPGAAAKARDEWLAAKGEPQARHWKQAFHESICTTKDGDEPWVTVEQRARSLAQAEQAAKESE